MDAAAIGGILAALVVAGIGGLFKLAMRGIDDHLKRQDDDTRELAKRVGGVELRVAEMHGMLQRNGLDERGDQARRARDRGD